MVATKTTTMVATQTTTTTMVATKTTTMVATQTTTTTTVATKTATTTASKSLQPTRRWCRWCRWCRCCSRWRCCYTSDKNNLRAANRRAQCIGKTTALLEASEQDVDRTQEPLKATAGKAEEEPHEITHKADTANVWVHVFAQRGLATVGVCLAFTSVCRRTGGRSGTTEPLLPVSSWA